MPSQRRHSTLATILICATPCLAFLLLPFGASAETGKEDWVRRWNQGGFEVEYGVDVCQDSSGNVYVVGEIGAEAYSDFVTIKYDSSGTKQWNQTWGGADGITDVPVAIGVDDSGNVYVTGKSRKNNTLSVDYDVAIVKYNSVGAWQWTQLYNAADALGGDMDDIPADMVVDGSGNIYICATSNAEFATMKYNSAGVRQWATHYNASPGRNRWVTAIAVDASGNVYTAGAMQDDITYSYDYKVVKYNASGVEQWVGAYGATPAHRHEPFAIAVGNTGNVYLTGCAVDSADDAQIMTVMFNSEGVRQWNTGYVGTGFGSVVEGQGNAIVVDGSGNCYVTGNVYNADASSDFVTLKYNDSGVQQWVRTFDGEAQAGDTSYDSGVDIGLDSLGNVYVTGYGQVLTGAVPEKDYVTIKYTSSGAQEWIYTWDNTDLSGLGEDRPAAMHVADDGAVVVTGQSNGGATFEDVLTLRYAGTGSSLCQFDTTQEMRVLCTGHFWLGVWDFTDNVWAATLDATGSDTLEYAFSADRWLVGYLYNYDTSAYVQAFLTYEEQYTTTLRK